MQPGWAGRGGLRVSLRGPCTSGSVSQLSEEAWAGVSLTSKGLGALGAPRSSAGATTPGVSATAHEDPGAVLKCAAPRPVYKTLGAGGLGAARQAPRPSSEGEWLQVL